MAKTITCKGLFGLGISSANSVFTRLSKSKSLAPIEFVAIGEILNKPKAKVVVFDSLKCMLANLSRIKEHQVVIVSDTVVLLQAFPNLVPLDWSNPRSFEFRFVEPNLQLISAAVKRKKTMEFPYVKLDHLGYYIDSFKQDDDTIQRFLRLLMGLPHNTRERIRESMYHYLIGKAKFKAIQETLTTYVPEEMSELSYQFVELFKTQAPSYREAMESKKAPKAIAKELGIDEYGISFFKKLVRAQDFIAPKKKAS